VRSLPLSRRRSPFLSGLTAFCLCLVLLMVATSAAADDTDKLPVPRFVSIGSDRANVRTGPGERYPIDEDFLAALGHMPPSSGVALGFDRLVLLATGARTLNDVIWTPAP